MNYDEQFHYKDLRSGQLTNGIERAAHRALLYSTGLEEQDLRKPLVAIVNSFTEMVPGHEHLRGLAQDAAKGVWEAGGVPREFNTIAICDGICQGHIGMRYPLPSRDLIADSIEYMVEAHQFDAMILMPGCDKIVPGMLIAAMRCNIPAIVISAGPMMPGRGAGRDMLTLTDMRELIGQAQTGKITIAQLAEAEKTALPGAGTCSMLGTANTMGCLAEVIGMSLPGRIKKAPHCQRKRTPRSRNDQRKPASKGYCYTGSPLQRHYGKHGYGSFYKQHAPSACHCP